MTFRGFAVASLVAAAVAAPAAADDSGSFVVQLGTDTTSVESYVRTPSRLEVNQVGRAPRVLRRHYVYELSQGAVTRFSMVVTPPGSTTPTQTINATVGSDSIRVQIQNGTNPPANSALATAPGIVVVAGSAPWASYEAEIMKLVKSKRDSLRETMYFVGAPSPYWLSLHRHGKDSVEIANEHLDVYRVRVDKDGRILGVRPIAGTARVGATRVEKLDLDGLAASFAAREQAGAGLGVLSPRDTVRAANVGGASIWIDYGRPGRRGRTIFGNVVPYGEVWRTGANAATQIRTDKPLDFGGTVVPAGFYSLWTLPTESGWKLIFNSATGIWGTEHQSAKDVYTVDMKVSTLPAVVERFTIGVEPAPSGGVLNLDWDTTRAAAAFSVKE
jgi:hypothetical protein